MSDFSEKQLYIMENKKRKTTALKPYDELTINERLIFWKKYQKGIIQFLENEKNSYFQIEKLINEIKEIEKKIKNIKNEIKTNETNYSFY